MQEFHGNNRHASPAASPQQLLATSQSLSENAPTGYDIGKNKGQSQELNGLNPSLKLRVERGLFRNSL